MAIADIARMTAGAATAPSTPTVAQLGQLAQCLLQGDASKADLAGLLGCNVAELTATLARLRSAVDGVLEKPCMVEVPGCGTLPASMVAQATAASITPRQREILTMIRDGYNNEEIARALNLTVGTVKIHITAIFKALGVKNRTQAMMMAPYALRMSHDTPVAVAN